MAFGHFTAASYVPAVLAVLAVPVVLAVLVAQVVQWWLWLWLWLWLWGLVWWREEPLVQERTSSSIGVCGGWGNR